ncbi:MAG: DNA gyrase inhibitor YacG [Thermodesulfatator sp.]|nr:MAG: DNA gyrase inhibitor YacG [Thermodesulfatator sp.]
MARRVIRCPVCRRPVSWEGNPYRPFCSERCRLVDLDRWLSEDYRISIPREALEEESEGVQDEEL